jgi:hypothetical protein
VTENVRFLLEKGLVHQIIPLYLLFLASPCGGHSAFLVFLKVFE